LNLADSSMEEPFGPHSVVWTDCYRRPLLARPLPLASSMKSKLESWSWAFACSLFPCCIHCVTVFRCSMLPQCVGWAVSICFLSGHVLVKLKGIRAEKETEKRKRINRLTVWRTLCVSSSKHDQVDLGKMSAGGRKLSLHLRWWSKIFGLARFSPRLFLGFSRPGPSLQLIVLFARSLSARQASISDVITNGVL